MAPELVPYPPSTHRWAFAIHSEELETSSRVVRKLTATSLLWPSLSIVSFSSSSYSLPFFPYPENSYLFFFSSQPTSKGIPCYPNPLCDLRDQKDLENKEYFYHPAPTVVNKIHAALLLLSWLSVSEGRHKLLMVQWLTQRKNSSACQENEERSKRIKTTGISVWGSLYGGDRC